MNPTLRPRFTVQQSQSAHNGVSPVYAACSQKLVVIRVNETDAPPDMTDPP